MYTSVIALKMKPGTKDDVMSLVDGMTDELRGLGCKEMRIIEHEPDSYTTLVMYENKATWEAASGKATELLGRLAPYAAEVPERQGGDVILSTEF